MRAHKVRALLMGGQACVLYGAAEFSRDTDFAILADSRNLNRLKAALTDLDASPIAVPPFELEHLRKGLAVHFRCKHPEAENMRVDVMSRMRGVDPFPMLWRRRTTIMLPDGLQCELLSLPDLVKAKKTQRDKDWPMIRRLIEAHYFQNRQKPKPGQIAFWLRELRTPDLLIEIARAHPGICRRSVSQRPLLEHAARGEVSALERGLHDEETLERDRDRTYWKPLRKQLEELRRQALRKSRRSKESD
jgi:hypothetical protein